MESLGGQPDVERYPAALGDPTIAKSHSETAQYNTLGVATSDFLPPDGNETQATSVANPTPPASLSSLAPVPFSKPTSTTLEEILIQGQDVGATDTTNTTSQAHEVVAAAILIGEGVEREPPAKKLKLDTLNGGEAQKEGGELTISPLEKVEISEDQQQLQGILSPDDLLSQRTLSQSSSLSDSTNPDSSTLSPDIQTTLAQLSTANLDIATRRTILLGRTKNKYICEVCGRECPSKHKLKRHLSTHSKERPFSCQICGKSFKWTEYLQKHMRQQHPGGVEGSPSQTGTSAKSPLPCSPVLTSSSQQQTTTSSVYSLPSTSTKSPPADPSTTNPSITSALSKPEAQNTTQKAQALQTVDSGISVNIDDVLNSSVTEKVPSDTSTSKPKKQSVSVGVNMDEEEELAEAEAMKSAAAAMAQLTPLEGLTINHVNMSVSVGGANLVAPTQNQVGVIGGEPVNIAVNVMGGNGGQIMDATGGGVTGGGGQMEISTGIGMQVGRGTAISTPHHIAMDSSGICYATASISQPLTTFANGNGQQQQQHTVMGAGGILQGYSDGSIQTGGHMGQEGNPLQQGQQPQEQQYTAEMIQQSLSVAPTCDLNDPNSIPASAQYSIPDPHQQQQTMQDYTDQQTPNSSMSEHGPNSMSTMSGLHSMTPSETVMMQDMSHITQYPTYSMHDPVNNTNVYGTVPVTATVQQTAGVVPQSLGTEYHQVTPDPTSTAPPPVPGPMELVSNAVTQPASQNSNVYANVDSYRTIEMQSQTGVDLVNYSTSQQSMMVQTQTDMIGGYGVMHNGLLQAQQNMSVNVMDPTVYGQTAAGGGGGGNNDGGFGGGMSLIESQQEQQQADNFISQQINKHMIQSQLESHGGHVTQVPGHMQQESTNIMQQQQPVLASVEGTNTEESDIKQKVIIVHEDDPTIERFPVMQKSKMTIEVGIQCEVGPETIKSLIEEEQAMADKETQGDDDEGVQTDEDNPIDRTVQKYPCEIDNCGKAYIHRKDLIRHMKIRHGKNPSKLEPVTVEAREKPFVCPVGHCGRSYYHQKDLRRHQRLCHKVNLETRSTSALKDNVKVAEDSKTQLRYPCDFPGCLRSYVHKKDLVRHKRLFHKDTATKPTIPIPVRYTESELKRIKHEVKIEIDKSIEKIRLDSTGSTASNATASNGDDPPNSSVVVEPEAELSSLNSTMDQNSSTLSASDLTPVSVTIPPQLVLYIDPNAPTSSASLVPTSSAQSQILSTSEALSVQSKVSAILSSMTANLPQNQAQLDSTVSLIKMATGEQPVDQSLITSEVASILGALEQAQYRQQVQQQEQQATAPTEQQQQGDGSTGTMQQPLTNLSAEMLSMTSLVSTMTTATTATKPSVSVGSVEAQILTPDASSAVNVVNDPVSVAGSKNTNVLESIKSQLSITQVGELAESATSTTSLQHLLITNTSQEPSELSTTTEGSC